MNPILPSLPIDWAVVENMVITGLTIAAVLTATWAIAKACRFVFVRLVERIPFLQREAGTHESVGASLGKIISLLVWLIGLVAVLELLGLQNVIQPMQVMVDQTLAIVPQTIGAVVLFFIGTVVAKIVAQLAETTLATANLDVWAEKAGVNRITGDDGKKSGGISHIIGIILYSIVMILFSIAALQTLGISSITGPAVDVLSTLFDAIPRLIAAAILLAIAFFIGRWVSNLLQIILPSLGFDQALQSLNVVPASTTPSAVLGKIALTAIMITSAIQAFQLLQFDSMTIILIQITDLGGRVLFGSTIIAIGAILANIVSGLVANSSGEGSFSSTILRYAVIALAIAMGLRFMGLANEIVNLAFGLILGAAAVACALAFGLGGRNAAATMLEKWSKDDE